MPVSDLEYLLRVRLEGDVRSSETAALLIGWLAADGFAVDGLTGSEQAESADVLGPAEWITLAITGSGSLTALIASLANLARARMATVVIRSADGREATIKGTLSDTTLRELISDLSTADASPTGRPDASG